MKKKAAKIIDEKRCIIFDLFDTLVSFGSNTSVPFFSTAGFLGVDSAAWNHQIFENSYARLTGRERDPFEILKKMAHAIDPSVPEEKIREAADLRMKRFHDEIVAIPARTIDVLTRLRSQGKRIGLISNADVTEIEAWSESPLSPLFDSTIFSCIVGMMKPEPGIYELSFRELGCKPQEAAFVGDGSCHELEGARKVGLTTILTIEHIAEKTHAIAERKPFADFVIRELVDLVW
jgi:putative hydrolase of the HAD superfamily